MFSCDVGDIPYITVVFVDANGAVIDPTETTLYLKRPDATIGTYTYSSGSVSKVASGTYAFNGTATMPGYWTAYWQGSGAAVAAETARYFVRGSFT